MTNGRKLRSNPPAGQGERLGLLHQRVLIQVVGHHELGQVAHHLGGGGDLRLKEKEAEAS